MGGISEGQAVEFTVDAYPTRTFLGKVIQVRNSPTTVNNVVTYDAVIGVTNSDYKLKPGMTANVSIIVAERDGVLKLPNAAMRFRPSDTVTVLTNELVSLAPTNAVVSKVKTKGKGNRNIRTVYLLAGDDHPSALKPVQVKVGITDGISTEILEGIKEGDKIVSGVINNDSSGTAPVSSPFGGGMPRH